MGSASGLTGGLLANLGGISISALVMRTATGLRSDPTAFMPSRCASRGIDPPPQNGSYIVGACSARYCRMVWGFGVVLSFFTLTFDSSPIKGEGVWLPGIGGLSGWRAMDFAISSRACARSSGSFEFSHLTSRVMMSCNRFRSMAWSSMVGNSSGHDDGSSTMDAKMTARHDASGLRAHHRWRVEGCPCRMDFSRADSLFMSASGRSISMSFLRYLSMVLWVLLLLIGIGL